MMIPSFASKIRPDHLDRLAQVYVRQSTLIQVRENTASGARQYDLAGRARRAGMAPGANPGHRSGSRALGGVHGRSRRLSAPRRPGRPGPDRGRLEPGSLSPGTVLQ